MRLAGSALVPWFEGSGEARAPCLGFGVSVAAVHSVDSGLALQGEGAVLLLSQVCIHDFILPLLEVLCPACTVLFNLQLIHDCFDIVSFP